MPRLRLLAVLTGRGRAGGAALLLAAAAAPAQLRGGDVLVADRALGLLYRIDAAGTLSTFARGFSNPAALDFEAGRNAIVADASGLLFRVTPAGSVSTVALTGLGALGGVAVLPGGDYLLTRRSAAAILRVTPAGGVSTFAAGAPLIDPAGIALDLDGSVLVTDQTADALLRFSEGGLRTTVAGGFSTPVGPSVDPTGDYSVGDTFTRALLRVTRGGAVSTIVSSPPLLGPLAARPDHQTRVLVPDSQGLVNRVLLVSPTGGVTTIHQGSPFFQLGEAAAVPLLARTNRPRVGGSLGLSISAGADAGQPYALAAAFSALPPIALQPPDPRRVPLAADLLFAASFAQNNNTFSGFLGTLAASGAASATLNIPSSPALAGQAFVLGGVVLRAGAPSGVSRVLNPLRIVVEP